MSLAMDERKHRNTASKEVDAEIGTAPVGAVAILTELTSLKLKLEKLMDHDFKAREYAKLRKEIFLNRLSKTKKHNLEDATRMKDEAMQLCQRWRTHRASDPIGLHPDHSRDDQNPDIVQSDSNIPHQMDANLDENFDQMDTLNEELAEDLREATDLMTDVQSKYENEEKWLRQRMDQLQKEAEQIEQFKSRLEKGRLIWDSNLDDPDHQMNQSTESNSDSSGDQLDQHIQDEKFRLQLSGIAMQQQQSISAHLSIEERVKEDPNFGNALWARFLGSVEKDVSSARTEQESTHNQIDQPMISYEPFPKHPKMREVHQMPSLLEQSDENLDSKFKLLKSESIHLRSDQDLDEEVVLNVSLVAAEVDFFCDCTLRETIVPIFKAESASYTDLRPSRIEIENEFLWKLTTSRQSSERGSRSSSDGRRPSIDLINDQINGSDELNRAIQELNGGPLTRKPPKVPRGRRDSKSSMVCHKMDGHLGRYTGHLQESIKSVHQNKDFLKEPMSTLHSSGTSVETMDTVGTSGSSSGHQKRTLADTVQATHQLRKQLYDIVSTYDKEVTYLLLSVEKYREQWKNDHLDTQKQLQELRTNVLKLEDQTHQPIPNLASGRNKIPPPIPPKPKIRPKSKSVSELKQYNPDLEFPVGKDKLSELNQQLIELHMKLTSDDVSASFDKDTARAMVNKILKQMLDIRADSDEKRAFLESVPTVTPMADGQESQRKESSTTTASNDGHINEQNHHHTSDRGGNHMGDQNDHTENDEKKSNHGENRIHESSNNDKNHGTAHSQGHADNHGTVGHTENHMSDHIDHIIDRNQDHAENHAYASDHIEHHKADQPDHIIDRIIDVQSDHTDHNEIIQLNIDFQSQKMDAEPIEASIVAYIVPMIDRGLKLLRSQSIEDISNQQIASEHQKHTKIMADRNVVAVSCERKRLKSFDTSFSRTSCRISDEVSIHEWLPPDLPRYVTDGELQSHDQISQIDAKMEKPADQTEPKVQLSSRLPWMRSLPVYDSSVDSGIEFIDIGDPNGKLKNAAMESSIISNQERQPFGCDGDFSTCQIHLHRYSMDGPAEFCRRSNTKKKDSPMNSSSMNEKSSTFSLNRRTPSPCRTKKPIETTNVGDAILAVGIQLMTSVMAPSKQWSDVARSVLDTSFTNKFKRTINYQKKLQARNQSLDPESPLVDEFSKNAQLPPKYGRRTVSEFGLIRPPVSDLESEDPNNVDDSGRGTLKNNSADLVNDHSTHRTRSEADVFSVKSKRGLKWKDNSWTNV